MTHLRVLLMLCLTVLMAANLWADTSPQAGEHGTLETKFPTILDVSVKSTGSTFSFTVTISSPYDTHERYADGFRVLDTEGNEMGLRVLWHDHANEQPFSRSLTGVKIPSDITSVFIEARDKTYGWSGVLEEVTLP